MRRALAPRAVLAGLLLLAPGCSETPATRADAGGSGDGAPGADRGGRADRGPLPDSGPPPGVICTPPLSLVDTSKPDRVVGDGSAAGCTRARLSAAVARGGIITFNCGPAPVTIAVDRTIDVPVDRDTVIDGGGRVTLDGQGKARILSFNSPNYRNNTKKLVLQRLTLQNGRASGTDYTPRDPQNPNCAYGYKDGAGGAVRVRDGVLQVIDSVFKSNRAASPGPDVGGGAVYVLGALQATFVGVKFIQNQGSNGGAVGLLQTTGTFVNCTFDGNQATGVGQNYVLQGCKGVGHANQGGAGGNGGAISIDGADDLEQSFCGVTFVGNRCNELGGCVFRTANRAQRKASFSQCSMDRNQAGKGGGCLYISNSELTISRCLVANNKVLSGSGGGVRTELNTRATIVNTTFYNNASLKGLMGALSHPGPGEIRNCTFAANKAEGGPALFTAALGPAGPVTVYNTVFSHNTTREPYNPQACWFTPKKGANNLQWPRKRYGGTIDDTACVENIGWKDALLGTLKDNGGPTRTLLPASSSPAIGLGRACPAVDQRGRPRPKDNCAAGAVEP
jgi:hypothetical protein